jgi:hypothetical protein
MNFIPGEAPVTASHRRSPLQPQQLRGIRTLLMVTAQVGVVDHLVPTCWKALGRSSRVDFVIARHVATNTPGTQSAAMDG